MSTCYLVSLYSFIMVPVDINWLYIKIGTIIVTMIISWNLLKRDGNDIGVVGLLSGVLLLIMTYFYLLFDAYFDFLSTFYWSYFFLIFNKKPP